MLRAQNRVLRCAQPASRRLFVAQNGYFDPKYCARATAQQLINALVYTIYTYETRIAYLYDPISSTII